MNERREPTISPLSGEPDTTPAKAREIPASSRAKASSDRTAVPVSSRPVIVRSPLGPFALILALVSLGGNGFLYWQSLQPDTNTQTELSQAKARITELEQRLALSDDESTQSLTVVQAKVKENASEIRKLWGVSHDTNRKAIAALDDKYAKLNKAISSKDTKSQQALKDLAVELQVLDDLTQGQQSVITRADKWMATQNQTLEAVSSRLNRLESDLSKRLRENEDAIKAIDAFRVQVNRELIRLKGG